jgi:hypothetical protein
VVGGVPARIIRMRDAPETLQWPDPIEPEPEGAPISVEQGPPERPA